MFTLTAPDHTTATYSAELSCSIDLTNLFLHARIDCTHHSRTRYLQETRVDNRYLCKSKIVALSYNKCVRGYIDVGNFKNGMMCYVRDEVNNTHHHVKIYKNSIGVIGMRDAESATKFINIIIDEINHINRMVELMNDHCDELRRIYETLCAQTTDVQTIMKLGTALDTDFKEEVDFINHSLCYADSVDGVMPIVDAMCTLTPISDYYVSINEIKSSLSNCRYIIGYDMQTPLTPTQFEKLVTGVIIAEMDPRYTTSLTIPHASSWIQGTKPTFTVVHDGHISSKMSIIIPMGIKNRSGKNKRVRITINSSGTVDHTSPSEDVRTLSYYFMHELLYYINNIS